MPRHPSINPTRRLGPRPATPAHPYKASCDRIDAETAHGPLFASCNVHRNRRSVASFLAFLGILGPFVGLAIGAYPARAEPEPQAEEAITLGEAIERAARDNVELRREKITVSIARANIQSASGAFDFVLTGGASFSQRITPRVGEFDIASGVSNAVDLDLGVSRALESGGTVSLGFSGGSVDSTSQFQCGSIDNPQCVIYSANLNLRVTHPLLRGFGREFTEATLRRRRIEADRSVLERQARVAAILRDVASAYWELSYVTQDLQIRASAVELARKQLQETDAQIDVGRLAPLDRAAVLRAIAARQQEVALAEQSAFFRSLELQVLLGQPLDAASPVLTAATQSSLSPAPVDAGGALEEALQNSPQLLAMRRGMELNDLDIKTARNLTRPRLDLSGSIGSTGRDRMLDRSLTQAAQFENLVWQIGLRFERPVENRSAAGNLEAARLRQERAWVNADALELDIRNSVLRLASNIKTAQRRMDLAEDTVAFARENLQAEEARFAVGRSTNNDVLLRQQELQQAEIQVVRAHVDSVKSEIALQALTGEILQTYGVALK